MSRLTVFADGDPSTALLASEDHPQIAEALAGIGVHFERWEAKQEVGGAVRHGDPQEAVIAAYRGDIDRLIAAGGSTSRTASTAICARCSAASSTPHSGPSRTRTPTGASPRR
jgi:cupin superfamily acireductone dioxygenase involved in methionine salvage